MKPEHRALRRALLALAVKGTATLGIGLGASRSIATSRDDGYPEIRPDYRLSFPRDHGAHPEYRTEWWYITGWLERAREPIGLQITFFRSRTPHGRANPSRFAPRQLMFGHAAIAQQRHGRLRHAEIAARVDGPLTTFSTETTRLAMGTPQRPWRLELVSPDRYQASIVTADFALDLSFTAPGPPVLQGDAGFSRKGPRPEQASHYYSRPHLVVQGTVTLADEAAPVGGSAWLDHEWSSEILDSQAAGWDWVGLNLDDGSALMAFRIRARDGGVVWRHGRMIRDGVAAETIDPRFDVLRRWQSPRSGIEYPVAMALGVGARRIELQPLLDDQELDSRASTGTLYWEGAVRAIDTDSGREIGRGYLELTGYGEPLRI